MNVSREIEEYVELLLKWNKKINLISKSSEKDLWSRHILDCEQLLTYIDPDSKLCDIGSGPGLPGLVLSILGVKDVVLVESDERKCAFLRRAGKISSNKIVVINERVEKVLDLECSILTCRAFASLAKILNITGHIKVNDKYLLLKGMSYKEEIIEAEREWLFEYKVHDSISDSRGVVLEVFDVRRRGNGKDILSR